MKRIYFVASDAPLVTGGAALSRTELFIRGPITKNISGAESYLKSLVERETGQSVIGRPRISCFKWVGIVALGRNWRWN